jgi:hypothetical protein
MAPRLIHKVVQPGKVIPSRCPNEIGIDQFLVVKAKTNMGTARTAVLRKTDAAMERELRGLDLTDGIRQ